MAGKRFLGAVALSILALSACGGREDPRLMNLRASSRAPDEFGILPTKPLQIPQDLALLPEPTPGGSNITDPTPDADAVAALGGNAARLAAGGVPAGDGALVNYASRKGRDGAIRGQLASEDLDYRRRNDSKLLERIFGTNTYFKAYAPQSLDQHAELERWRSAGARNVGAPPKGIKPKKIKK